MVQKKRGWSEWKTGWNRKKKTKESLKATYLTNRCHLNELPTSYHRVNLVWGKGCKGSPADPYACFHDILQVHL